jgi:hypothetical protein
VSYKQAVCAKCGKPIQWRKTPAGKWMPLDVGIVEIRLDPKGKTIVCDDYGKMLRGTRVYEGEADAWGRVPHWGTCPNADEFRRKKEAAYGHERAE